jgi:hypothetical protein
MRFRGTNPTENITPGRDSDWSGLGQKPSPGPITVACDHGSDKRLAIPIYTTWLEQVESENSGENLLGVVVCPR